MRVSLESRIFRIRWSVEEGGEGKKKKSKSDEWKQEDQDSQDDEEGETDDVGDRHHPGDSGPTLVPWEHLYVYHDVIYIIVYNWTFVLYRIFHLLDEIFWFT